MPTLPTSHVIGDTGHTADHNLIVTTLTAAGTVLRARQTSAQSITTGTWTTITLDTTDELTISGASRSGGVVTLPVGTYVISAGISWGPSGVGWRYTRLLVDGVAYPGRLSYAGVSSNPPEVNLTRIITVTSGTKTVALQGYQDAGSAVSTAVAGTPQEVGCFLEVVLI